MRKLTVLTMLSILCIVGCSSPPSMTRAKMPRNEYVVLLHGLARSENTMIKMQKALIKEGYGTCNIGYPSRQYSIEDLTQTIVFPKIQECIGDQDAKLSFVTHSMGGIIVRNLLKKENFKNLNAVVMLSPPNQGSEVVDTFGDVWLFEWMNGPAGRELGTDAQSMPNRLGPATFKLGIITGSSTINPILSLLIPGDDDGKVSTQRAKLSGMSDFMVVPVSHPFIMKDDEVIQATLFFLENHRLRHGRDE